MAYLSKFDPTLNDWRSNTMNTKHTPGPWNSASLNQDSDHMEVFAGISDGDQVAVVKGYGLATGKHYEAIANARLIAAAPELLEALQMLSETAGRVAQGAAVIDERGFNTLSHSISIALAAIAKATGNTNL
jgi:hypothetical protein